MEHGLRTCGPGQAMVLPMEALPLNALSLPGPEHELDMASFDAELATANIEEDRAMDELSNAALATGEMATAMPPGLGQLLLARFGQLEDLVQSNLHKLEDRVSALETKIQAVDMHRQDLSKKFIGHTEDARQWLRTLKLMRKDLFKLKNAYDQRLEKEISLAEAMTALPVLVDIDNKVKPVQAIPPAQQAMAIPPAQQAMAIPQASIEAVPWGKNIKTTELDKVDQSSRKRPWHEVDSFASGQLLGSGQMPSSQQRAMASPSRSISLATMDKPGSGGWQGKFPPPCIWKCQLNSGHRSNVATVIDLD